MLTIGLDVHQSGTAVCILDDRGVAIKEVFFRGHPRDLVAYLRDTVAATRAFVPLCLCASVPINTVDPTPNHHRLG